MAAAEPRKPKSPPPPGRGEQGSTPLPPGQQLAASDKWPIVGEKRPLASDEPWTVAVEGLVARPACYALDALRVLPRREQAIDLHCVTRWSRPGVRFAGVPLAELLSRSEPLPAATHVRFVARSPRQHDTSLPLADALALETLVTWEVEGMPLPPDHGGPVRTVVPGRYFYKSLKWLARIELLAGDRLGFWEREAGYHNTADPWREQRYMAPTLTRLQMREVLRTRAFAGRDLRGLDAPGADLAGLDARGTLLRDAALRGANLGSARLDGANLSNARLDGASLRDASLVGADLEGASLVGADLRGADLRGASLFGATLFDPASGAAAILDTTTHLDRAALDQLLPEQSQWLARVRPDLVAGETP